MSVGVVVVDAMTSIVVGFVFFTRVGYLAYQLGEPIEDIAHYSGSKMAYVVYPESILRNKIGPFQSIMFFFALSGLGITSQIAFAYVVSTALLDLFPALSSRRYLTLLVFCFVCFLLSSVFTFKGGNRWVDMLITNVGPFLLLTNGLLEIVIVGWVYGINNLYEDLLIMIGSKPSPYFRFCWKYIIPLYMVVLIVWTLVKKVRTPATTEVSVAQAVGFMPLLCILIFMGYSLWRTPQPTFRQRQTPKVEKRQLSMPCELPLAYLRRDSDDQDALMQQEAAQWVLSATGSGPQQSVLKTLLPQQDGSPTGNGQPSSATAGSAPTDLPFGDSRVRSPPGSGHEAP